MMLVGTLQDVRDIGDLGRRLARSDQNRRLSIRRQLGQEQTCLLRVSVSHFDPDRARDRLDPSQKLTTIYPRYRGVARCNDVGLSN